MLKRAIAVALLSLALPLGADSPAGHVKEAAKETKAAVKAAVGEVKDAVDEVKDAAVGVKDKTVAAGDAVVKGAKDLGHDAKAAVDKAKGEALAQVEPMQALKENSDKHWHNKIVHFPLALGVFGALFFILSLKWPNYLWPSRLLLASTLVSGFMALRSGEAQEAAMDGTSLIETMELHERLGQVGLGLFALTLLLSFFPSARKWSWIVALGAAGCILVTGGLGGVLGHS